MKNTKLIALVFISVLFSQKIIAQQTPYEFHYPVPAQLEASKKFTFSTYPPSLAELIFPIGWSKDGKFAFASEPVDEVCGCYFFELEIIDTKTDSLLFLYYYSSDEGGSEFGIRDSILTHNIYLNRQKIWIGQYDYFSKKLNQYNIIPGSTFALHQFPMITSKDTITLSRNEHENLSTLLYSDSDYVDSVLLIRNGNPKNFQVAKVEYAYKAPISIVVEGYLKSPYGNEGVILLNCEEDGWEGPPEIYVYHVIGFSIR